MDFVWCVDANKRCAIVSCDLQRHLPITKWTVAVLPGVSADGQYQKQQRFAAPQSGCEGGGAAGGGGGEDAAAVMHLQQKAFQPL